MGTIPRQLPARPHPFVGRERALDLAREHHYREGEANTLDSLGTPHLRPGHAPEAMRCLTYRAQSRLAEATSAEAKLAGL